MATKKENAQKTHEEYFVGVRMRYEKDEMERKGTWSNALMWYPGRKGNARYVTTEAEARKVLAYAYKLWNGEKAYNEKGERYETSACGGIGITTVSTKKTDEDMQIVAHIIRKRTVTDWEEVKA